MERPVDGDDAALDAYGPCLFLEDYTSTNAYISIFAESFRPQYAFIHVTLASLAEPISRPALMHEYRLTPFSLGVAVSNGVEASSAIAFMKRWSYNLTDTTAREDDGSNEAHTRLASVCRFITVCMARYNKVRLLVESNDTTLVQCADTETAQFILQDAVIRAVAKEPVEVRYKQFLSDGEMELLPYFLLQNRATARVVAERCVLLGLPTQQQYDYEHDPSTRSAYMSLRSQTRPRQYQVEAVEAACKNGVVHSGCLLLPCGAGKTLVGIMLMAKVKKPTLVVCAGSVSVEQWKTQILDYATLEPPPVTDSHARQKTTQQVKSGAARISCLTGKQKDDITQDTDVVLTTYSMLVTAHRLMARKQLQSTTSVTSPKLTSYTESGARRRKSNPKEFLFASYGLLILDEVHMIPAEAFSESLGFLNVKSTIGLTATYVREDSRILNLFHLVGPKLYDVSMESLVAQGFLAKVNCIEIHCPMSKEFGLEYLERRMQLTRADSGGRQGQLRQPHHSSPVLVLLAASNPLKMLCVQELVHHHLKSGSKILVFCDHIMLLEEYGRLLNAPVICGKTQHRDRLMVFSDFQSTAKVNVVCVSRVGDVSVNLPSANVVIQVSSHGGSRRQEAQRLGRILRPKERASNGKAVEAWFYSIISSDTLEVEYAAHRAAFLVDQGYSCRIIEFDPSPSGGVATLKTAPKEDSDQTAVKQAPVGDITTIKQEHLNESLHGSRVLRGTMQLPMDTALMSSVGTLPYQLNLLARVVANWEIDFQQAARKRKRADGDVLHGVSNRLNARLSLAGRLEGDSDSDVEVVEAERPFQQIKQEWKRGVPAAGESQSTGQSTTLHAMAEGEDGFVYHEM